jgi:S-adenosylmethionine hydrolase
MAKTRLIALLTDFGIEDPYVGEMKAVIYGINPEARVIDISHHVPPQDIQEGAFILYSAYKYFPGGTIFVSVVDPGVGTRRRIVCLKTKNYTFLAPDNELLSPIVAKEKVLLTVEVTDAKYFLPKVSSTFHGRDVFAPVAAHLSKGLRPTKLGKRIDRIQTFPLPSPVLLERGVLEAEVIHIDRFGNLITSVDLVWGDVLQTSLLSISIKDRKITRISQTYQDGQAGELLALFGSSGHLEISVNMGNAREALGCTRGDKVIVRYKDRAYNDNQME